jgi:hypothetical protein
MVDNQLELARLCGLAFLADAGHVIARLLNSAQRAAVFAAGGLAFGRGTQDATTWAYTWGPLTADR